MNKLAVGTKSSIRVTNCQVCDSPDLEEVISLGHLPQVNVMADVGTNLKEELFFPAELLKCNNCSLVQISHIVDPEIIFPPSYSYTSRTTKILREGFAQLAEEVKSLINLKSTDLIVDIGSNDGTLLSNFKNTCEVLGVEPTDAADYAIKNGINSIKSFFTAELANKIKSNDKKAKVVTSTNCFAHIENVHEIVNGIKALLDNDGVFINESHYLIGLMQTVQYDTIYHEHLRYYSLTSLKYLLEMHDLEIFNVNLIPTHGGSIRVYAANKGKFKINSKVETMLNDEKEFLNKINFLKFKDDVVKSKLHLNSIIKNNKSIGAIGCPSRAITLINYAGLNEDILKFVLEAPGSQKINKYVPGTKIPVLEETSELINSVECLLLLSWHIADEIIPKLKSKGFKGSFITPLPFPMENF